MSDPAPDSTAHALPVRASLPWLLALVVLVAAVALALGAVVDRAVSGAHGTLLVPYDGDAFGLAFSYPVYDDVHMPTKGSDRDAHLYVDRVGQSDQHSFYETRTTDYDSTVTGFLDRTDGVDARSQFDYDRTHCVPSERRAATTGELQSTAVRAHYSRLRAHGLPVSRCEEALRYPSDDAKRPLQVVTSGHVAVGTTKAFSYDLITYAPGGRLTAGQRAQLDGVVRSVRRP